MERIIVDVRTFPDRTAVHYKDGTMENLSPEQAGKDPAVSAYLKNRQDAEVDAVLK